jgi:hypothetical protein
VSIEEMTRSDKIRSNDLVEILFWEKKQLLDEAVALVVDFVAGKHD